MKKINTVCLVVMLQLHSITLGADNKSGIETSGINPNEKLIGALFEERVERAKKIIDENDIEIGHEGPHGQSFLHLLSEIRPYIQEIPSYVSIAKKLITGGCPINKPNDLGEPCLSNVYDYRCSNVQELADLIEKGEFSKSNYDDDDEWVIFNTPLSDILIKNGALLMIYKDEKKWNILDDFAEDIGKEIIENDYLRIDKYVIQDAFYKTFNRDYKQREPRYLTTALIFNRIKKDKKFSMPKVLVKYIASFSINPVEHIEATIIDAGERLKLQGYLYNLPEEVRSVCDEIKALVTPGVWEKDWCGYRGGDRSENNLIVKAMKYVNDKKNVWDEQDSAGSQENLDFN